MGLKPVEKTQLAGIANGAAEWEEAGSEDEADARGMTSDVMDGQVLDEPSLDAADRGRRNAKPACEVPLAQTGGMARPPQLLAQLATQPEPESVGLVEDARDGRHEGMLAHRSLPIG